MKRTVTRGAARRGPTSTRLEFGESRAVVTAPVSGSRMSGTGGLQIAAVVVTADGSARRGKPPSAVRANRGRDHRAVGTHGRPATRLPYPVACVSARLCLEC